MMFTPEECATPITVASRIADGIGWTELPRVATTLQTTMPGDKACGTLSSVLHAGRGVIEGINTARVILHIACTIKPMDFDMQGYNVDPLRYIDERAWQAIVLQSDELLRFYPWLESKKRKS